jgi:hypothetical protein
MRLARRVLEGQVRHLLAQLRLGRLALREGAGVQGEDDGKRENESAKHGATSDESR